MGNISFEDKIKHGEDVWYQNHIKKQGMFASASIQEKNRRQPEIIDVDFRMFMPKSWMNEQLSRSKTKQNDTGDVGDRMLVTAKSQGK